MSERATLTMEMSSMAISAAHITATVMPSFDPTMEGPRFMATSASGLDGDEGAHARAQRHVRRALQADQHRHALHHLHEVARGVVRREQREARSRGAGQAVDLAVEDAAAVGVDLDLHRLPGAHLGELI